MEYDGFLEKCQRLHTECACARCTCWCQHIHEYLGRNSSENVTSFCIQFQIIIFFPSSSFESTVTVCMASLYNVHTHQWWALEAFTNYYSSWPHCALVFCNRFCQKVVWISLQRLLRSHRLQSSPLTLAAARRRRHRTRHFCMPSMSACSGAQCSNLVIIHSRFRQYTYRFLRCDCCCCGFHSRNANVIQCRREQTGGLLNFNIQS